MKTKTSEDPVLAEVHAVKDRLAAKFGYDIVAMLGDAQRRQAKSRRRVVDLSGTAKTRRGKRTTAIS